MNDREFTESMEYIIGALREKGYDPYEQLYGYVTENEPGYITRHKNARAMIQLLNVRDVRKYLDEMQSNSHTK